MVVFTGVQDAFEGRLNAGSCAHRDLLQLSEQCANSQTDVAVLMLLFCRQGSAI